MKEELQQFVQKMSRHSRYFVKLPEYLNGTTFFKTKYNFNAEGTVLTLNIYHSATIYISAYSSGYFGGFNLSLPNDGWEYLAVDYHIDDGNHMSGFWKKSFVAYGKTTITLPKMKGQYIGTIFVKMLNW